MKKCAIYTRVSTDMQAEVNFNSCDSQEEKIMSFINSQDTMKYFKTYSDPGYSGGSIDRPALQELLRDVQQKKIDLILSYKIDRLTRSSKDFFNLIELLNKYGADFISVTERFDTSTPSGRLLRNIMLTFAQFEREQTSERVKDKMHQRARKGIWNGGTVPYGYRSIDKKLVVEENEAKVVNFIFHEYVTTGSLTKVHQILKDRGIKHKNKYIHIDTLAFLLRNSVYAGNINYAGNTYQGVHDPIISQALFDLAQTKHKKKIRRHKSYKKLPFAGIITCKECNSAMYPTFTNKYDKKGHLKRYFYYQCVRTTKDGWDKCGTKQVNADRLEMSVLDHLQKVYDDNKYLEYLVFKINHDLKMGHHPSIGKLNTENYYSPNLIKNILFRLLNGVNGKKGFERCNHIKKYIKEIIYAPEEIGIKLIYKDFSVEDAGNLIVNKPLADSRTIRQDSSSGHKDNQNGISPFTDFLESSIKEMVAGLRLELRTHGFSVRCSTN